MELSLLAYRLTTCICCRTLEKAQLPVGPETALLSCLERAAKLRVSRLRTYIGVVVLGTLDLVVIDSDANDMCAASRSNCAHGPSHTAADIQNFVLRVDSQQGWQPGLVGSLRCCPVLSCHRMWYQIISIRQAMLRNDIVLGMNVVYSHAPKY